MERNSLVSRTRQILTALAFSLVGAFAHADTMNIQLSPILLLVGGIFGEADVAVNSNWTIGADFGYLSLTAGDLKVKGSSIGPLGKYYFNGVFNDGAYLKGSLVFASAEATYGAASASASGTAFGFGAGYHWFWSSFNLSLGGTYQKFSYDTIRVIDSNGREVDSYDPGSFRFDFLMGFKF